MNGALGAEGAHYAVIFAFQILPTIIFIAALFAILYYFGVMQIIVRLFAVVMNRVMGASGAESLNVAASIFMGQTEAPLTIRPFLPRMTQSELMTVMTSGMAHISGGIMAAYIAFGIEAQHLLTAVIMTAPGTLMMAKMFVPETETPETRGTVKLRDREDRRQHHRRRRPRHRRRPAPGDERRRDADFVRRADLPVNGILGTVGLSLQMIFGWVFAPVAWSLGVPWKDAADDRQPARHAHGAERVHRLRAAGHAQGHARPALVHHRDLRAVRLRQLRVDRHADRRHRRAGADAARRPGAARLRAMLAGTLANFVTAIIVGFLL